MLRCVLSFGWITNQIKMTMSDETKTAEEINELSEKFKHLFRIIKSLEACTDPIKNHPDPNSIDDCWNWIDELLIDIKSEYNKTKKMLTDFQKAYGFTPYCHPNGKQFTHISRELTQQQSANAELKKQNAELVEALKTLRQQSSDIYDHCIDGGYLDNEDLTEGQELLLAAFESANKIINTPPKN